jgi:hypothetical protein
VCECAVNKCYCVYECSLTHTHTHTHSLSLLHTHTHTGSSQMLHLRDLSVDDSILCMALHQHTLLLGLHGRAYSCMDVRTGQGKTVFQAGKLAKPVCAVLSPPPSSSSSSFSSSSPSSEFIVAKDNVSVVLDPIGGKPRRTGVITWSDALLSVCYHHPYIIGVLPRQLEVRSFRSTRLLQVIPMLGGAFINENQTHTNHTHKSDVLIGSYQTLLHLCAVPIGVRVDELLRSFEFKEAMALINSSKVKTDWPNADAKQVSVCVCVRV